jgi:hypothetical protein
MREADNVTAIYKPIALISHNFIRLHSLLRGERRTPKFYQNVVRESAELGRRSSVLCSASLLFVLLAVRYPGNYFRAASSLPPFLPSSVSSLTKFLNSGLTHHLLLMKKYYEERQTQRRVFQLTFIDALTRFSESKF